jgi:peroxiredoxin
MWTRLAILIALPLAGCATTVNDRAGARVAGDPGALPGLTVAALDGTRVTLAEVLGGKPALISLWATWCEACVEEFDAMRRLSARAPSEGAVVLSISVGEPVAKVADYVRREKLDWPQYCDEQYRLSDALGESRVPTTLVISRAGRIVYRGGKIDEPALAALNAAIAASPDH